MKTIISIIIPIYNVEDYLLMCLQSVVKQTMTEGIECILVDDCGKDNSVSLAQSFIQNYKGNIQFRLIRRQKNGGLSAARNTGIEASTGEYLFFLDSDDEITSNCMVFMYGLIKKYGNVDLVQGSFYETQQEFQTRSPYKIPEYLCDRKQIKSFLLQYKGDIVGAQSRLIRKDFLYRNELMFKEGIIHEDNYWTFFLAKHVETMAFCPIRTYYHRYNPNSITGNINIQKEAQAYSTIIETCSSQIDQFLPGHQKELILNTLITVLNNHFYTSESQKDAMISSFTKQNSPIEKLLLSLFLLIKNKYMKRKLLHLLIRIYKF